jgi:hypothetical protein
MAINMPILWVGKSEIDEMVYQLYGLKEEEIKIVKMINRLEI